MTITASDIKEVITAREAVQRGIMREECAKEWPHVAICENGDVYAMRWKQ